MSEQCRWIHEQVERLPLVQFPFDTADLPQNGIYFFYEEGESWGHGGEKSRIVRVGTHKKDNFRARIAEHYLLNQARMNFSERDSPPRDRSIFRKHIGSAILQREGNDYLQIWEQDLVSTASKQKWQDHRNIPLEKRIEAGVTDVLRSTFSFRYVIIPDQEDRMGETGLERTLIGTLARCTECCSSPTWLGRSSPKRQIRESGLWLIQHLSNPEISPRDQERFLDAVEATLEQTPFTGGNKR